MNGYKHLGDFSATPPEHSRFMFCDNCEVSWVGCWDNFMCPECGKGEIPTSNPDKLFALPKPPEGELSE